MEKVLLPEWFVPWGVLAICGVVILIAVIVIIACSSKKGKPAKVEEKVAEEKPSSTPKQSAPKQSAPKQSEKAPVAEESKDEEVAISQSEIDAEEKKPTVKVYHVSKRKEDGKWQVRIGGGAKAIKLFATQAEAIAFAKQRAENQDGRIVIHKEDGSFRKLNYKK